MRLRRRIEVTVEHEEIILVRRRGGSVRLWCSDCEDQVSMLRVEDAAALAAVTPRTIYRWVEAGKVHFAESDQGLVLVCAESVATLVNRDASASRTVQSLDP